LSAIKILQVSNKPPSPSSDGGSMVMYGLAGCLSDLGHEISVLAMITQKHKVTEKELVAYKMYKQVCTVEINTTARLPAMLFNFLFSKKPYNAVRFISQEFEKALISILKTDSFHVIQLEGLYVTPYISTIRKYSDAVIVLRTHNVEYEIWKHLAISEKKTPKKLYLRSLAARIRHFESGIINCYDMLVPVTQHDLEQYNLMGNIKPAMVCPAGYHYDRLESSFAGHLFDHPDANQLSLFFLGSLDWIPNREGIMWFVQHVFPVLINRYPQLKLHIAGRNAPGWFIRTINRPGVVFHGEVAESAEFMRSHDILVSPCFSGSGMRVKIVEAMALGKAVITTPLGAEGLSAEHGINIILATEPQEYVTELMKLLEDPDLCIQMGTNARKLISEKFNIAKVASKLAEFYYLHLK
jgi:polysaccharide biosynthesis protein PslH